MGLRRCLAASFACCCAVSAAVSSTGFTVELGEVPYFLPPKVIATVEVTKELFGASPFVPFTVVKGNGNSVAEITAATKSYLEEDDVFQEGFLEGMFLARRTLIGTATNH